MPVYRPVGNQLVRKEEYEERVSLQKSEDVTEVKGKPLGPQGGEPRPFGIVAENRPLLVEIRHVYTGELLTNWLGLSTSKDMLVTSAVRSLATYNASPKAINFLEPKVEQFYNMRNPKAGRSGTPIVFYVPALTDANCIFDIEIVFDKFDSGLLEGIASAFTLAAGIPLFAAYSTHLLAAGAVTKLAGSFGERLFDGKASFSQTFELSFKRGGVGAPKEGFHIIVEDNFVPEDEGCVFDSKSGRLISKDNQKEYTGPHPYIVISLDGEGHKEYDAFVPTAASAALLERFYHIKDGQQEPAAMLMEAVKLYSDLQYKLKADNLKSELANLDKNSDSYKELDERRQAYLANLITDVFKT